MKTFVVSVVSIVLVSILLCPMVMSAPTMPDDVQIVQPDPSLPKELSAFWGKWEWTGPRDQLFVIVEKIDKEKASLYVLHGGGVAGWPEGTPASWQRYEANVIKDRGKYKLWYHASYGNVEYTLKGEYLTFSISLKTLQLRRVN